MNKKPKPCFSSIGTTLATPIKREPVAPPVYRPQPLPKVLQTKQAHANRNPVQPRIISARPVVAAQVAHPRLPPAVTPQPRINPVQPKAVEVRIRQAAAAPSPALHRPVVQRTVVQGFKSSVVQAKATKFYPNLHPGAAVPVERSNIFTLDSFANQYRLRRNDSHTVNVPNMKYNFVRNREGQMLLHNRYRHPSLAEGQQVLYAGEVFFNNGTLQWWSNGSGHYQPDADGAEQANLPMDCFYSYQQIIKGEHLRK
ncbi:MAG: hypothetical protein QOG00_290 [Pyrinomonadaceae bacterium]|nr:hypothetical protein [Pyrinomonadaceae bacterium]